MPRSKITIQSTRNKFLVFQACRAGKHDECMKESPSGAQCICECHLA